MTPLTKGKACVFSRTCTPKAFTAKGKASDAQQPGFGSQAPSFTGRERLYCNYLRLSTNLHVFKKGF